MAQASTPDESRAAWDSTRNASRKVVADQLAYNDAWNIEVANAQDKYAAETFDQMRHVRNARRDQTRGEVPPARDSKGWRVLNLINLNMV